MRPLPCLTAVLIACIPVAVLVATPVPAMAQVQTYYHAGAWDAFSGRNGHGGAICGIGSTNPADERRLSLSFDIGGSETVFSVSKPNWSIPDNTKIVVVMQLGLNTPWTMQGVGHNHMIDWSLDQVAIQAFDRQFRGGSSMTLTFPEGTEPPWTMSLAGSTKISDTFGRCMRDLTQQVQASQAPANPPPDTQTATQPFAPPPPAANSPVANSSVSNSPVANSPVDNSPVANSPLPNPTLPNSPLPNSPGR